MSTEVRTFFAVEALHGEDSHAVAGVFATVSSTMGRTYKHLDCLDTFTIGTHSFVRFSADIINPWAILDRLLLSGRAVIGPGKVNDGSARQGTGYLVQLPQGRTGTLPVATMHSVPRALKSYRGPGVEHWQGQFPTASP